MTKKQETTKQETKQTKICKVCGKGKTLDLFEFDGRLNGGKGGRTNRCYSCKAGSEHYYRKKWRALWSDSFESGRDFNIAHWDLLEHTMTTFDERCAYCGEQESAKGHRNLAYDHIFPLQHGGENYIENLVVCCKSCNSRKSDDSVLAFHRKGGRDGKFTKERLGKIIRYVTVLSDKTYHDVWRQFLHEEQVIGRLKGGDAK